MFWLTYEQLVATADCSIFIDLYDLPLTISGNQELAPIWWADSRMSMQLRNNTCTIALLLILRWASPNPDQFF